uniref:Uncharacterized protein n=1 Tax=Arundo donax TaxID=35708 RepID=A0A0A9BU92_ARUDO
MSTSVAKLWRPPMPAWSSIPSIHSPPIYYAPSLGHSSKESRRLEKERISGFLKRVNMRPKWLNRK